MTFVIAEAGVNHNGNLETAFALIDAAKEAGADAVKFQMFDSGALWADDRIAHLEMDEAEMLSICVYCQKVGIEFMCTPFDVEAVRFLAQLVERMKIASGCLENLPLLAAVRETGLPVILSTGMSDLQRIWGAVNALNARDLTLLHCVSAYPCPDSEANLAAMDTLHREFLRPVGYSDHTEGIVIPIAAVARGAKVIEKHLTLDRNQDGPDHRSSIEPEQFKEMVKGIRSVEKAIGSGVKALRPAEANTWAVWRDQR